MGFFGEMFGGGERCPHGLPKGEPCKQCDFDRDRSEVLESIKESICPHGEDWRTCAECKKTGWMPGDREKKPE